jgi:hypothetical protein
MKRVRLVNTWLVRGGTGSGETRSSASCDRRVQRKEALQVCLILSYLYATKTLHKRRYSATRWSIGSLDSSLMLDVPCDHHFSDGDDEPRSAPMTDQIGRIYVRIDLQDRSETSMSGDRAIQLTPRCVYSLTRNDRVFDWVETLKRSSDASGRFKRMCQPTKHRLSN